ncbi:MAG TPA: hypothetical protein P5040_09180, partial [Smithella sp.]|nr:hypothetical protein [Smithella sp.]
MRKILSVIVVAVVFAVVPQPGFAGEGFSGSATAAASSRQAIPPGAEAMRQEMEQMQRRVTDLEEEMRQLKQTVEYLGLQ